MRFKAALIATALVSGGSFGTSAVAQYVVEDSTDDDREHGGTFYLPYAFSTETLSTGVGLAIINSNDEQPQQNAFVTG